MIRIWINGQQREGIDEGWIVRQVQGHRRDGSDVCVRVSAKGDGVDMAVTAGICPSGPGGGRQATMREQQLFRLWGECHLAGDGRFAPGQLIQCLKSLERAL